MQILDYRKHATQLRRSASPVSASDLQSPEFQQRLSTLRHLLNHDGIGLAATQVGWLARVFLIKINSSGQELDEPEVVINPVIKSFSSKKVKMEEGCLSLPGLFLPVKRPDSLEWSYQQLDGSRVEERATGFYARVIQHEADHLDGKVFIDRVTGVQKLKVKRWLGRNG